MPFIRRGLLWVAAALAAILSPIPIFGEELIAPMTIEATGAAWQAQIAHGERLVLSVAIPGGTVWTREFGAGVQPSFLLQDLPGQSRPDGTYVYELRAVHADGTAVKSGAFSVRNGTLVAKARKSPRAVTNDVLNDDLLVRGLLCAGVDCGTGASPFFPIELPGPDALRLKNDSPAMRFIDTSEEDDVPGVDWQLTANEVEKGGLNKFSIEDITNRTVPFTVAGAAATDSLFIDALGKIGFGTATPATSLHIKRAILAPSIRLEPVGAGHWEIFGSFNDFVIQNLAQGSFFPTAPFSIGKGAPNLSLRVASSGKIGLGGISNPVHPLQHSNGAFLSAGGVWTNASSRDYKNDVRDLDACDALDALEELRPVTYVYKNEPDETYAGFIAEEAPDLVAMRDRKSLSPMDVVAVLTKVMQEQQKTIEAISARLEKLER